MNSPEFTPTDTIHLVTNGYPVSFKNSDTGDVPMWKLIYISLLDDYISRMMAHYLALDEDTWDLADSQTLLAFDDPDHPFASLLEYTDLKRPGGKVSINQDRLGIAITGADSLEKALLRPYRNPKQKRQRPETPLIQSDEFPQDPVKVAVFSSASISDASGPAVGEVIGRLGLGCIVGGNGKEDGNAMRVIAENAFKYNAAFVGMISTEYLYQSQGAGFGDGNNILIKVASSMDERLQLFWEHSDLFLGVTGGIGVIMEVLYVMKNNINRKENMQNLKPLYLLNYEGFWDTFIRILKKLGLDDEIKILSSTQELEHVLSTHIS